MFGCKRRKENQLGVRLGVFGKEGFCARRIIHVEWLVISRESTRLSVTWFTAINSYLLF